MAMLYLYRVEIQGIDGAWSLKSVQKNWSVAERIQKRLTAEGLTARVVSHAIPMYTKTIVQ